MSDKKQLTLWVEADLLDFFHKQADKYFEKTKKDQYRIDSVKTRNKFIAKQLERIRSEFEDKEDE